MKTVARLAIRSRALPLVLATLAMAGCGHQASAPPAQAPEVGVVTLAAEPVSLTTELPGRTSAYLVAEIRPQVNGIVLQRAFEEGGDVKKGALLYQIDPAPYQAAYDQAKAALAMAEAAVPAARTRAERLTALAEIDAAGKQDADEAKAALGQAEASVAASTATLAAAKVNLDYTPVRAPIAGRIGRSSVTPGALVTAYQPVALAVIQQLDPIYVDVTQASADLLRLRRSLVDGRITVDDAKQRKVHLVLEDGTPYPLDGTLEFRDATVDPTTGSVTLRMVFPNPDHVLLPGMYVRAILETGTREAAILAPQQGISRDTRGRPYAFVVGSDETVEQRFIKVDRAIGNRWLVTDGLNAGERMVVDGLQRVRPGAKVTPVAASLAPAEPDAPAAR